MADAAHALERDAVDRVYRVRPLQAGMLFHDLLEPDAAPYYRQVSYGIVGEIHASACEEAWNGLLQRHAMLRSIFDCEQAQSALQIVLKTRTIEFHFEDADGAEAWRRADAARGFDLRHDRLMRVALFRLAPGRYEMVWTHPHVLLDGWSGAILAEEFAALYTAALHGTDPALPPPTDPDSYLSAIAARDDVAAARHWAARLDGHDELATLPRHAAGEVPHPAEHLFHVDAAQTACLMAQATVLGVTPGIMLQALWGVLLGRWTGRDDVVFGIVTSGRSVATPGIARLVGMFINTLPVRVRWGEDDTFGTLVARLGAQAITDLAHDHVALAAGVIDHLLVLENFPAPQGDMPATGFTVIASEARERANYDFGIIVQEGDGLTFTLQHDAVRMPVAMMRRIEAQWRVLIDTVIARTDVRLSDLDIMPPDETRSIAAFDLGPITAREDTTLAALWHTQVHRTPDAPALIAGDVRLNYRRLDAAAEGVAQRLHAHGIGPGAIVGVLAARGAERIVALLGIVKAGAAYLPLSPALPDRRIADMIADAACTLVLADEAGLKRIDAEAMPIAGPPAAEHLLRTTAAADDIAYIIYTSGSTGRPKGVAVEHRAFVNMILAQIEGFGVDAQDRTLQFASCSFDASLSEIFMALLTGACLVVALEEAIRDGGGLVALIAAESVTVATLPPSYLRALERADLAPLRVLITAGEAADIGDARHYARGLALFNAYGPTENAVCTSWHRVDPDDRYPDGIPIGRAITNTGMHIRDARGRRMPLGAIGEIWLSGRGLARGYVGQGMLTAERFPTVNGDRFYRTGDAGRMRDDGEILYLGRIDAQLKVNGHRIEPGEIEQRLRAHPAVAQAAVVMTGDPPLLGAFVVPYGPFDGDALRRHLAAALPAWMVPAIVPLAVLPTTIAGKIDRRALSALKRPPLARIDPLEGRETIVAEALNTVLKCGPVGRDGSFVALGGDSLRAIRLLGRLRRAGLTITLKDMLAADTVAAIARTAEAPTIAPDRPVVIGVLPLTPVQRWFFAIDPEGEARLNHLVLLDTKAALDPAAMRRAFDTVWRRHDALRLRFRQDGEWRAEIAPTDPTPRWRCVDLRDTADPWPTLTTDAMAHQPGVAAGADALFVATHYRLRGGDHILLAAHHLLVDAVTWRVLVEELEDMLADPSSLPPRIAGYAAWAVALAGNAARDAAELERPYWQAVADVAAVEGATPWHDYDETDMLTADLGAVDPGISDRCLLATLLAASAQALKQAASHPDHLSIVRSEPVEARALNTSFDRLRTNGSASAVGPAKRKTVVMLSSHGRHPLVPGPDVSRTAGWFTADYPFLLQHDADPPAIERALDAVPSGGVGWSVLRWLGDAPPMTTEAAIGVNYLGDTDLAGDSRFTISDRLPGVTTARLRRRRRIEIEAHKADGRLHVALRYAPRLDATSAMEALLGAIRAAFQEHYPSVHQGGA